jgi:hypothetical protein
MLLRFSLPYDVPFVFSLFIFCRRFIFYLCLLYLFSTAFPYQMMFVSFNSKTPEAGADLGFQARGAHLAKLRRVDGGAKICGVFRVKNHDFTPKNHIFSNFRGGARRVCPPVSAPGMSLVVQELLPFTSGFIKVSVA